MLKVNATAVIVIRRMIDTKTGKKHSPDENTG
jgi:hypothetical protein